jgi:hypothetical protein
MQKITVQGDRKALRHQKTIFTAADAQLQPVQPVFPAGCHPGADAASATEIEDAAILFQPRLYCVPD